LKLKKNIQNNFNSVYCGCTSFVLLFIAAGDIPKESSSSSSKNFISVKPAYSFNKKKMTTEAAAQKKYNYIKTVTITTRVTNLFYYNIYKITFTPS
jgi:hypothetical protein